MNTGRFRLVVAAAVIAVAGAWGCGGGGSGGGSAGEDGDSAGMPVVVWGQSNWGEAAWQ